MSDMSSIISALLAPPMPSAEVWDVYRIVNFIFLALMAVCALVAIVIVLFQPSNSSGIDALGGSSETFFGKNKGKSMESKMKKWTTICLIVLAVLAIIFFILQSDVIWGVAAA